MEVIIVLVILILFISGKCCRICFVLVLVRVFL